MGDRVLQSQHRQNLFEIYLAALNAVKGEVCVRDSLSTSLVHAGPPLYVVAIGKAAESMTVGAMEILAGRVRAGLIISKTGHFTADQLEQYPQLELIEAGHPIPDLNSLYAGKRLMEFLATAPSDAEFLFLISGGASSLVEVPNNNVTLELLQQVNQWLLSSGLDIQQMNAVRKGLSAIKGGQLINAIAGRAVKLLMISDVPGDRVEDIGSGLLSPTAEHRMPKLPVWLKNEARILPHLQIEQFLNVDHKIVASNADALESTAEKAKSMGYRVLVHNPEVVGETHEVAQQLVDVMNSMPDVLHIWGGETTLTLPKAPGRGGRNQSLSLAAATHMNRANNYESYFLAAGTDGSDGPGHDAGGMVDSLTVTRGEQHGLHTIDCLRNADAGRFLDLTGDLISTGPTGTNVMDIMLGYSHSRS